MKVNEVANLLQTQIMNLFGLSAEEKLLLEAYCSGAYADTMECLKYYRTKYSHGGVNPYNSVIYNVFLYWLGHALYFEKKYLLADKVYYLSKALNGNDIFYAIDLPKHWLCEHPVAAVLGRANYGDFFFFYQGCTVGGSRSGNELNYPIIGENVTMFSDSKVLGKSVIGSNCVLAANSYVIDQIIPDNKIVFGKSPDIIIKENLKTQKEWLGI